MTHIVRSNHTAQHLEETSVHNWYRFVLSYPDHLVVQMLAKCGIGQNQKVLDPFVGTGTILVECKKLGIHSIGVDANPVTAFASRVKTTWDIDVAEFDRRRRELLDSVRSQLAHIGHQYATQMSFDDLLSPGDRIGENGVNYEDDMLTLFPKNWISQIPLRKVVIVKQAIDGLPDDAMTDLFRLALMSVVVNDVSNLGFGPEVYVSKKRKDADVYGAFTTKLRQIADDLYTVQSITNPGNVTVYCSDARCLKDIIQEPIDAVITSPPYPNEKDYTRTTRLELILMGFIRQKSDLRSIKNAMLRSHTRNIFVADNDSMYVHDIPEIQAIAQEIEQQRIERGATSGFERLYHRVVTEYFGGMYRVLEQLQQVVRPGGKVALVVGDQMSFFRVPVRTAHLLRLIACRTLDYKESETLVWRTRRATATRMDIEEHILILERQ